MLDMLEFLSSQICFFQANAVLYILFFLTACVLVIPENIVPIDNFRPDLFMDKWYEIARLDHLFEKG